MPLIGQGVFWADPWNLDPTYITSTYEVNMPPSFAFTKVYQHRVEEYGYPDWFSLGRANIFTLLLSIRSRRPDGSDEQINFPMSGNMTVAHFDHNMTSVTYGLIFASAATQASLVLDFWS